MFITAVCFSIFNQATMAEDQEFISWDKFELKIQSLSVENFKRRLFMWPTVTGLKLRKQTFQTAVTLKAGTSEGAYSWNTLPKHAPG